MKNLNITLSILIAALTSFASTPSFASPRTDAMKAIFSRVESASKGPLGPNAYQSRSTRISVGDGNGGLNSPPSGNLMTVAFRSSTAEELARYGFYLGNRFTSGYLELHSATIAGSTAENTFTENHRELLASDKGAGLAQLLAAHTILERHYRALSPNSSITKSYYRRGVADAEHEAKYYQRFLEYLAKYASDERFLLLSTLDAHNGIRDFGGSVSLSHLRVFVDEVYNIFVKNYGKNSDGTLSMYKIRNGVHNGLSPQVLTMLNAHIAIHGAGPTVKKLKGYIEEYFTPSFNKLQMALNLAEDAIAPGVKDALRSLVRFDAASMDILAENLAAIRTAFAVSKDPNVLPVIRTGTEIFLKAYARIGSIEDWSAVRAITFLRIAYANGWIRANHFAIFSDVVANNPGDAFLVRSQLQGALSESDKIFADSFDAEFIDGVKPLSDWTMIAPKMENFKEELLRASVLPLLVAEMNRIPKDDGASNGNPSDPNFAAVENIGVAYGYLRFIPAGADLDSIPTDSIVILEELPHKLGVVQGIITEKPQDFFSHVNIKSRSRVPPLPNLYFPQIRKDPNLAALIERNALVRFETRDGAYSVKEASLEEAQAFWSGKAAKKNIVLEADIESKQILSTHDLGYADFLTVGAKAANYAELHKVDGLDNKLVLEAFGLPFYYYQEFMTQNGFDVQAEVILREAKSRGRDWLVAQLKMFRDQMRAEATWVNEDLIAKLTELTSAAYPDVKMRFRSSTNSEDLPNFSGAGLYESTSYKPGGKKKTIQRALKKVWSSVWTQRAFDERAAFGIDHLSVKMGILISPSFQDELANGVIVSRMFANDGTVLPAVHFNNQIGEASVTNPEDGSVGEELMVEFDPNDELNVTKYKIERFRYSNITGDGVPVIAADQLKAITQYVLRAHNHFRVIYERDGVDVSKFALDFEFKLDDDYSSDGSPNLHLKQARPYVVH